MKAEFKAKLIQHLANRRNSEEGFTLIELLVVIIIIGILAAIALPSFLNQAAKARQSEGSTYVGTLNRTQQAYFVENNKFAATMAELKAGVPTKTDSFSYKSEGTADKATNSADKESNALKSFQGQVQLNTTTQQAEAKLCITPEAGQPSTSASKSATDITKECTFAATK
ncbi:MAG: prepilin-type N-terminal cleavage/methylation domain-containing protein [Oscillatoriales cyanobacterium]|nr:MAG: prepilin-type N-terminal cleavage/methylation domain-containing protein [Oscillatoriales cyanobacterium]